MSTERAAPTHPHQDRCLEREIREIGKRKKKRNKKKGKVRDRNTSC
jgi:hypothetical protein